MVLLLEHNLPVVDADGDELAVIAEIVMAAIAKATRR
jgi:hypothetical protein